MTLLVSLCRWIPALGVAAALGCSAEAVTAPGSTAFEARYTKVVVEIDYQEGAEPIVWSGKGKEAPFRLFEQNLEALFLQVDDRQVEVPRTLADMEKLAAPSGDSITLDEIRALAAAHRGQQDSDTQRAFYVIFLGVPFEQDGEVRGDLLGLSLTSERLIAVFRAAVDAVADDGELTFLHAFIEQSTMTHEFGHAVGFVNNGLSMTSEHHDAEHGAHCTNEDCIMHYASEGAAELVGFIKRMQKTQRTALFGLECLSDAFVASGGDPIKAPKSRPKRPPPQQGGPAD